MAPLQVNFLQKIRKPLVHTCWSIVNVSLGQFHNSDKRRFHRYYFSSGTLATLLLKNIMKSIKIIDLSSKIQQISSS